MSTARPDPVSLQFYDDVAPLVTELVRAMAVALDQGHAVLCAVSDSTRLILEEQLTKRGIDVSDARTRGQYVHLDAVGCVGGDHPQRQTRLELASMMRLGVRSRVSLMSIPAFGCTANWPPSCGRKATNEEPSKSIGCGRPSRRRRRWCCVLPLASRRCRGRSSLKRYRPKWLGKFVRSPRAARSDLRFTTAQRLNEVAHACCEGPSEPRN